jgi:hypothetical protein
MSSLLLNEIETSRLHPDENLDVSTGEIYQANFGINDVEVFDGLIDMVSEQEVDISLLLSNDDCPENDDHQNLPLDYNQEIYTKSVSLVESMNEKIQNSDKIQQTTNHIPEKDVVFMTPGRVLNEIQPYKIENFLNIPSESNTPILSSTPVIQSIVKHKRSSIERYSSSEDDKENIHYQNRSRSVSPANRMSIARQSSMFETSLDETIILEQKMRASTLALEESMKERYMIESKKAEEEFLKERIAREAAEEQVKWEMEKRIELEKRLTLLEEERFQSQRLAKQERETAMRLKEVRKHAKIVIIKALLRTIYRRRFLKQLHRLRKLQALIRGHLVRQQVKRLSIVVSLLQV